MEVLKQVLRADEMIARVGGDEFVIFMPGVDEAELEAIVERIRTRMSADRRHPRLSMSLGTATVTSPDQLNQALTRADQRMYRDKAERKSARLTEPMLAGDGNVQ